MREKHLVAVILILLLSLTLLIGVPLRMLSVVYPPGWEMYNQCVAVRHKDNIMKDESDFTHPRELMGVYWKVDWDNETSRCPTIQVEMGDLRHVDFMGQELPNTQPADTLPFERGNMSYYLDYHIYMYTVTIRTIADKKYVGKGATGAYEFYHETSWPLTWDAIWTKGTAEGGVGEPFEGGVYVKFVIDPWKGFTYRDPPQTDNPDEEWYELENCWAGVMNTYVFQRKLGQVENQWGDMPSDDAGAMFVKGGLDTGNQVPMFVDDGSFGVRAPRVDWDPSITPDTEIESTVVQYLPVQMLAGADVTYGFANWVSKDVNPCDVYIMYTLRVDVLTSHGFILHTAKEPPVPVPPSDYFSWAMDWWDSVFAAFGALNPFAMFGPFAPFVAFIAILIIVAIVIVVLLAMFAPHLLKRGAKGLGEARRAYSGNR